MKLDQNRRNSRAFCLDQLRTKKTKILLLSVVIAATVICYRLDLTYHSEKREKVYALHRIVHNYAFAIRNHLKLLCWNRILVRNQNAQKVVRILPGVAPEIAAINLLYPVEKNEFPYASYSYCGPETTDVRFALTSFTFPYANCDRQMIELKAKVTFSNQGERVVASTLVAARFLYEDINSEYHDTVELDL